MLSVCHSSRSDQIAPAFFRNAAKQLSYLNPEPDRWKDRAETAIDPALDRGTYPDHFIDMEYGQKSGRRVGAAVSTTILLGPLGLLTLFSKKQNHFLTIGYTDEAGKEQVAVFKLNKEMVRTALPILEARSGKKVEYQSKGAEKKAKGK